MMTQKKLGGVLMKMCLCILMALILALGTAGCAGGGGEVINDTSDEDPGTGGDDGDGSNVVSSNMVIEDTNGEVGKALNVDVFSILLISSKDYFYSIDWAGNLDPVSTFGPVYYSNAGCSGTAYYSSGETKYYGKSTGYGKYNNKIYKFKTLNTDGTPYYDTENKVTCNSVDNYGTCNIISNSAYFIELVETDRESVGIPTMIVPPLKVVIK